MTDLLIIILTTLGSMFILVAAIGILRMPDFYLRLSVTIKAATLGMGCVLGAVALYFTDFSVTTKVFAIIFFLTLTAPVAGHMIGRTAYYTGVKLWKHSVLDELKTLGKESKTEMTGEHPPAVGHHTDEGENAGDQPPGEERVNPAS